MVDVRCGSYRVVLHVVALNDEERVDSAKPADVENPLTPASASTQAKAAAATPLPHSGKRTLKNVKTMFFVGTEVRSAAWFRLLIIQ